MNATKKSLLALAALTPLLFAVKSAQAATDTKTQTVTATVAARASLTLSAATLTFADSDPDAVPNIAATEGAITVTAKTRTTAAGTPTLTVVSGGDLTSGANTIAIGSLTWAGTGTGFNATGTMNKTTPQSVASWTGSGNRSGTVTYSLANSWTYATGSYTATLTYTLTAP